MGIEEGMRLPYVFPMAVGYRSLVLYTLLLASNGLGKFWGTGLAT